MHCTAEAVRGCSFDCSCVGLLIQEYRVTSFEQRLMSEIEFRLERTPVEESDDEVKHEDIPSGKCIAPIFEKKLRNYRAMEGVPVTFSCKIMGIPVPKVCNQITKCLSTFIFIPGSNPSQIFLLSSGLLVQRRHASPEEEPSLQED